MLFAHLKRILRLDRLRLRGPCGARDEFLLAATAQNLRKLAKLITVPSAGPGHLRPHGLLTLRHRRDHPPNRFRAGFFNTIGRSRRRLPAGKRTLERHLRQPSRPPIVSLQGEPSNLDSQRPGEGSRLVALPTRRVGSQPSAGALRLAHLRPGERGERHLDPVDPARTVGLPAEIQATRVRRTVRELPEEHGPLGIRPRLDAQRDVKCHPTIAQRRAWAIALASARSGGFARRFT